MFGPDVDAFATPEDDSELPPLEMDVEEEETGDSFVAEPLRWEDDVEYNGIYGKEWKRHYPPSSRGSIDLGLSIPGTKKWELNFVHMSGANTSSEFDIHDNECSYIEDTSMILEEGWNTLPYNQHFSMNSGNMDDRQRT